MKVIFNLMGYIGFLFLVMQMTYPGLFSDWLISSSDKVYGYTFTLIFSASMFVLAELIGYITQREFITTKVRGY